MYHMLARALAVFNQVFWSTPPPFTGKTGGHRDLTEDSVRLLTRRLRIRPYEERDAQDAHAIFSDPFVMQHCEPAYTLEKTKATLAFFMKTGIAFAVVLRKENKVIGHLLFKRLPGEKEGVYEIGWIFSRAYWRQGYAQEAAGAAIRYGFEHLSLRKVMAETIDPVKSAGLMRKLGMKQEAVLRGHARDLEGNPADLYRYAIIREEKARAIDRPVQA
jgi:ribosomal-protein-alanine N-acetyltransferase